MNKKNINKFEKIFHSRKAPIRNNNTKPAIKIDVTKEDQEEILKTLKNNSYILETKLDTYEKLYNNYITQTFSGNILSLINQMIQSSTTLPENLKENFPVNKLLLGIVKETMMNDLEIIYFSLFLDKYGWVDSEYDVKIYFMVIALCVKKFLNEDNSLISHHLFKKYSGLKNAMMNFILGNEENIFITPRELNQRNILLKKPFNKYCTKNYIDYNQTVDNILTMSMIYNGTDSKSVDKPKKAPKKRGRKKKEKNNGLNQELNDILSNHLNFNDVDNGKEPFFDIVKLNDKNNFNSPEQSISNKN